MDSYAQIQNDLTNIQAQVEMWTRWKQQEEEKKRYEREYEDARSDAEFAKQKQDENLALQKEAFEYQKQLNKTQMEREDTAHKRELEDFLSMGFSPLAVLGGNGAGATSLQSASAPQYDNSQYLSAKERKHRIAQERAENILKNNQLNNEILRTNLQSIQLKNSIYDAKEQRRLQARGLSNQEYKNFLDYMSLGIQQQQTMSNIARNNSLNMLDSVQIERLKQQNALDAEYILSSAQEREWNKTHGYRNQALENYLITLLDNHVDELDFFNQVKDYFNGEGEFAMPINNPNDKSVENWIIKPIGNRVKKYYEKKYGVDAYDFAVKKVGKNPLEYTWDDFRKFRSYILNYKK